MRRVIIFFAFLCSSLFTVSLLKEPARQQAAGQSVTETAAVPQAPGGDTYVYADFEKVADDKRPLSSHDGWTQINTYQESTPPHFKGLNNLNPPAPERVRLPNGHGAITFDYELFAPNGYSGVGVKIDGEAGKDGKPVADDLSAYRYLVMDIYVTGEPPPGVPYLRVECESRGQGIGLNFGFPQSNVKVQPGLHTYKVDLKKLSQPQWVQTRVSGLEVLKKLTAVSVTAYCEGGCSPIHGTVVIDDIVFQK